MRTQVAYCSACSREVEVLVPADYVPGSHPTAHDAEACICLAYGTACTGTLCPLFSTPTEEMAEAYRNYREGQEDEP